MNYPKLNQDFKKRWVEALRSGDYEQGRHSLYEDGKYCCLGVACAIEGVPAEKILNKIEISPSINPTENLSPLARNEPRSTSDLDYILAFMNDVRGMNFHEIANWIEENL